MTNHTFAPTHLVPLTRSTQQRYDHGRALFMRGAMVPGFHDAAEMNTEYASAIPATQDMILGWFDMRDELRAVAQDMFAQ